MRINPRFVETLPRRGYRFIGAIGAGAGATRPCDERAARGGAAVLEPERRRIAGILHRRPDRGDDRAARPALPRPHRRHRALVVDGLQGQHAAARARSARRCARTTCSRAASAAKAIACASPPAWSRPPARRISGPKPTSGTSPIACRCSPTSPRASPNRWRWSWCPRTPRRAQSQPRRPRRRPTRSI